jgi:hypothetical protein
MADTGKSEAKHRTKEATDVLLVKRQAALSEAIGYRGRVTADMAIYAALLASDDKIDFMAQLLRATE